MRIQTLSDRGRLYRGNLHLHTTASDGRLSPTETLALYKQNGYAFCAVTDHWHYGWYPEEETEDFLVLAGCEFGTDVTNSGSGIHHIVAFAAPEDTLFTNGQHFDHREWNQRPVQALVDFIRAHGNEALYCHPYWSLVEISDTLGIKGCIGMEIYNHAAEVEGRMGSGEVFYDHALWHGERLWAFGTDDAHGGLPDYCGGSITVKTEDFSHRGIMEAIRKGSFYASQAMEGAIPPEIRAFYLEDGAAHIECSGVKRIHFVGRKGIYPTFHAYAYNGFTAEGELLTSAVQPLVDGQTNIRAVVVDDKGNCSWTQPIFL